MTDYKLLLIGFCFLLAGCEQKEMAIPEDVKQLKNLDIVQNKAESTIRLTRVNSFGESEKVLIGSITGLAVTDQGEVMIADNPQKTIHIFDKNGAYQGKLGREGLGPGEFQLIGDMKVRDNILQVLDRVQFRMNIFNVEDRSTLRTENVVQYPKNVEEYTEISNWIPNAVYPLYGQHLLTGFMQYPWDSRIERDSYNLEKERIVKYYLMDYEGNIISDKVFEQRDNEDLVANVDGDHLFHIPVPPVPFLRKTVLAISKENKIYTAWTNDFLIKAFRFDGSYSKAYYVPNFGKRKIDKSELSQLFGENDTHSQRLVKRAELPEFWPAIFTIETDDEGRLWVASISEDESLIEWWVFDNQGELLAKADMPGEFHLNWLMLKPLIIIKDGFFYQRERDNQKGIDRIVKYKFELTSY